ncbi:MAG TPA: hypothetical protein VFT61_05425 [Sphingomicrobium sp.]|nr:hypothetical protein [Sphingomicrobium sp.]
MRRGLLPLLILAALAPTPVQASHDSCTIREDDLATTSLEKAKSLSEIYEVSARFPGCFQGGGTAEEASDDVVVRLSHHWRKSIRELKRHENERAFIAFVRRHIDATTDPDGLKVISNKARTSCPAGAKALCRKIDQAARVGLHDLNAPGITT